MTRHWASYVTRARIGTPALIVCLLLSILLPVRPLHAASEAGLSTLEILSLLQIDRAAGCGRYRAPASPLRRVRALSAAAVRWSEGAPLEVAIDDSGYRAERSVALQYSGDAAGLRAAVLQRLCRQLAQSHYRDVGLWSHGNGVWILLASPFETPAPDNRAAVAEELLDQINRARAQARRCGRRRFASAPPLALDARLNSAATREAQDMLLHDFFDHRGSDGSTPAVRVADTGYRYHLVGENIAEGAETVSEAVQGWLASPGHCENIMEPSYRQTGVAFAVSSRGEPRIYWVQDFGAPAR